MAPDIITLHALSKDRNTTQTDLTLMMYKRKLTIYAAHSNNTGENPAAIATTTARGERATTPKIKGITANPRVQPSAVTEPSGNNGEIN